MELRGVLESTDVNEIRAKTDALNEASRNLANAVYAQATAAQQASASGNGSSTEDEVVEDADYEVIDEEEAKTS
jgi:molecular chaperone DnaK